MKSKSKVPLASAPLRRRAEAHLHQRAAKARSGAGAAISPVDTQRLVHELEVHRVELEMQSEEFQHTRNKLETGLEKYNDLYDFAPVGYMTLDPLGTILEANLTAASLLGINRDHLVKRRFGLYVSADDLSVFNAFLVRLFESHGRQFCEVTLLKPDKPPLEIRIEAVLAASGRECRAALQDITGRNQAEAAQLVSRKLESTGILAGGIAHDFNNLLTVILLNLELARTLPPYGEELATILGDAKKAVLIAHTLTQQLITFAHGSVPIRIPTRLSGVIQESVQLALTGSNVKCEFSLVDDLWLVEVDISQIGQVLRNIILNAREAMPAGGTISVRMENVVLESPKIPSLPPGKYVRVSVTDQGGGIAKEVLPKIFDPYFSTKERGEQKGMGLGLTICHAVLRKHGGTITVNSKVGVGTTFHLYLPTFEKAPDDEKSSPPGPVSRSPKPGPATSPRHEK
jgi:PAS domain S-box-containing protein